MTPVRLAAVLGALLAQTVWAAPLAYVVNEKSATISIVDTVDDRRIGDIAVGRRPRGAAGDLEALSFRLPELAR